MRALRELNTTKSGLQAAGKLAADARVFGGFYRDLRMLTSVAEAKMEQGLTIMNNSITH